jgi:hypothetical protein
MESEKSQCVPPIPGKDQMISNSRSENSPSHYNILPERENLSIKQRHNSDQGIADIQSETAKNPEYDDLPLRTFHNILHSEVSNKCLLFPIGRRHFRHYLKNCFLSREFKLSSEVASLSSLLSGVSSIESNFE